MSDGDNAQEHYCWSILHCFHCLSSISSSLPGTRTLLPAAAADAASDALLNSILQDYASQYTCFKRTPHLLWVYERGFALVARSEGIICSCSDGDWFLTFARPPYCTSVPYGTAVKKTSPFCLKCILTTSGLLLRSRASLAGTVWVHAPLLSHKPMLYVARRPGHRFGSISHLLSRSLMNLRLISKDEVIVGECCGMPASGPFPSPMMHATPMA